MLDFFLKILKTAHMDEVAAVCVCGGGHLAENFWCPKNGTDLKVSQAAHRSAAKGGNLTVLTLQTTRSLVEN